jgi:xylulokinase
MTAGDEVTVGIDVGTSSVKAVAADGEGNVVARSRVPHAWSVPTATRFEHDAKVAWHEGPRAALAALGDVRPVAVAVGAMVPSLAPVGADGVPIGPGLLYGDDRGRDPSDAPRRPSLSGAGELAGFLRWLVERYPDAHGYWPAQAVANHALAGEAVISTTTAATAFPLFDWVGWDAERVTACGARVEQLPRIAVSGQPAGTVGGAVLEPGTIDALGDQIVAGADEDGDVLVLLGTTLIVWVVTPGEVDAPGWYSIPHTSAGHYLLGGPSNAGGLFLDWAGSWIGARGAAEPAAARPDRVPVWAPYPRGERVPMHDPSRRAALVDLDLTHDAAAVRRAAVEAAGFVVRRAIDAAGVRVRRVVAAGGGTLAGDWVQAIADCTGLPVDVLAMPDSSALGCAFVARVAAGLESSIAEASRWARYGRRVEPDPAWRDACAARYQRFLGLAAGG